MCLSETAHAVGPAGLTHVRLEVGGRELSTHVSAITDGTEVWAPLDILKAVGADAAVTPHGDTIVVSEKSTGRSLELAMARVAGTQMIALSDLAKVVDGTVVRLKPTKGAGGTPASVTVVFAARITDVRFEANSLAVITSFPVQIRLQSDSVTAGNHAALDCDGVVLDGSFRSSNRALQVLQIDPVTARVLVNLPSGFSMRTLTAMERNSSRTSAVATVVPVAVKPVHLNSVAALPVAGDVFFGPEFTEASDTTSPITETGRTASIRVAGVTPRGQMPGDSVGPIPVNPPSPTVTTTRQPVAATVQPPDRPGVNPGNSGSLGTVTAEGASSNALQSNDVQGAVPILNTAHPTASISGKPVNVQGLTFITDNQSRARIEISFSKDGGRPMPAVRYVPSTGGMEIDLPNAQLNLPSSDNGDREFVHPLVNHISIAPATEAATTVRLKVDTARIVGYSMSVLADKVVIELRIPRNASGALADKLVVVDAGHGGTAAGAKGTAGGGTVYEKSITLQIATKLRAALEQYGARVVMTRESDTDVPLYDRPRLANTIGADLFISIHNDSTPNHHVASGTTTYFHASDPSSRALAMCVQEAVHGVTGLPGKGALSDTTLYPSGLAVLRGSTMPAVLCEVAYINNASDCAKLVDAAFQQRVAMAMCDGLRSYIEGRPRVAAPQSKPEPEGVAPSTTTASVHEGEATH